MGIWGESFASLGSEDLETHSTSCCRLHIRSRVTADRGDEAVIRLLPCLSSASISLPDEAAGVWPHAETGTIDQDMLKVEFPGRIIEHYKVGDSMGLCITR